MTLRYRCDALTNQAMKPLMLGGGQLGVHVPVKEMSRNHEKGECTSCVVAQKSSTPSTRIPLAMQATGILNPC